VESEPPENIRGIFILSRINDRNKDVVLATELLIDGVRYAREEAVLSAELAQAGNDCDRNKILKRQVKRQIFLLLSDYTGAILPWGMLTGIRPAKIVYELLQNGQGRVLL
jgi:oxygen-independent coproporphyrinogen-3 oxidase